MEKNAGVLTPAQTLIVRAIVAKQGFAAQIDLGTTVGASDRAELEANGFVREVKREHDAIWLKLEDAGWTWAQAHLTKAPPPNQTVLHNPMVRLDAHLEAEGETLAGLIGTSPKAGQMGPELTGMIEA